jgi:alpha-amylase/alpha-mannosidase (GH57 family)
MDYETFGEHQWADSGIFQFIRALPQRVYTHSNYTFKTPSEVSDILQPVSPVHVPTPISWADEERDLTAWLGNELQDEAFHRLYEFEQKVKCCKDENILTDWKYLQTSDHFYYMCTKWFSDGDVHKYFNPYNTPYEAFINYMNALSDFIIRIEDACKPASVIPQDTVNEVEKENLEVAIDEAPIKRTVTRKKSVATALAGKVVKPKVTTRLSTRIVKEKTEATEIKEHAKKSKDKAKKKDVDKATKAVKEKAKSKKKKEKKK